MFADGTPIVVLFFCICGKEKKEKDEDTFHSSVIAMEEEKRNDVLLV
jgi:hypothetical protein